MKRTISACLSSVLILLTPGLAPYEALAQSMAGRAAATAPLAPALRVGTDAPVLSAPAVSLAPSLLSGPSLAAPSAVPAALFAVPAALKPAASAAVPAAVPLAAAKPVEAVRALRETAATPKLAEKPAVLNVLFDSSKTDVPSALDPVAAAASASEKPALQPYVLPQRQETSVIGAARTPKGYARAAVRRLADGWPYLAIGVVAALAHYFIGPEAALAVIMLGGPCAAFRAMQDSEALRLGINDESRRRAAMEEMQAILRQYGRDAAREGESNPEIQSRVDAEIMTRATLQGLTHALEHFLKTLRAAETDLPAARARFKQLVKSAVIGAVKANGMPGDDESMIEKVLDKTGLVSKIADWEIKHQVVESMLEAVREERKKGATSGPASSSAAAKKDKEQAGGAVRASRLLPALLLVAGALLLASGHAWAAPLALLMIGPVQPQKQPELPPLPDTPMVHHLQLAGYVREEIEFFLGATRDVAETPASPLEGRHEETRRVIETLSRPSNRPRSVLLYGPKGSGKRSIVETLSREIAEKRYKGLEDARVLEFDASAAVGGNVEGLALQLRALLAKSKGKVILYLDGPDHLKNQNNNEHNFFKILAPFMARGEVTLLVTADEAERRLLEDKGPFPFEHVEIAAPSIEKAAAMLEAHGPALADRYGLRAVPGVFEAAARLAARYLSSGGLPGAGLDLLERTFASISKPARLNRAEAEFRRRLERVSRNLRRLKQGGDDADAAMRRRNAVSEDLDSLYALRAEIAGVEAAADGGFIAEGNLAVEASRLSGIPASRMLESEREKLLNLEAKLSERVVHQDEAIRAVSEAVRRARAGLKDPRKPIGSFLFLGPTGVGKTELTKGLAEILFDSEENMVRLDMSEYMEPHSVARLIGAPPGYVGFDGGGQLTEAVRARPYSVVLLDEVEKAHPDVLNVLLQAMDDGRVTDGQGRTVSFGNVIFVLTSNLGSAHIMKLMQEKADRAQIKEDVMGAVREHFRPEFINRLDETVIFNPLGRQQAGPIVDIHLNAKVRKWLADQGIALERASQAVVEKLADLGFDPLYGGRPLARAIQRHVLNPLSAKLLAEKSDDDDRVRRQRKAVLTVEGDEIVPTLENLPSEPVAERWPAQPEAYAAWRPVLGLPQESLTVEALEAFLFGPPEKDLPAAAHGAFKPMGELKGGEALETVTASTDDPNLKDPALSAATAKWIAAAKLTGDAAEALRRWLSKVARCAKSTNNTRPAGHEPVSYSVHDGDGFREYRVKGLPLTRAELLLNARIFENHYSADSKSEDESWELADKLLGTGEYGRAELFEIKRLLTAIPGAEFGYHSDRTALTFWLRMPAEKAAPAAVEPPAPAPAPAKEETPAEPHSPIVIADGASDDGVYVQLAADAAPAQFAARLVTESRETVQQLPGAVVVSGATKDRVVTLARVLAALPGAAQVRVSRAHAAALGLTAAKASSRLSEDDSDTDAPTKYRFLTQDAPEHMRSVHALIAGLLSAANPIAVFWGFRFARASLGEAGFAPMRRFLPPLAFLNTDARNAYLAEETLSRYYQAPGADPGASALVDRAIADARSSSGNQDEAARELALGGPLPEDLSKRFVDGIVSPYKKFVKNHGVHRLTRRTTIPLWIGAAIVVVLSLMHGEWILFTSWPGWASFFGSAAILAAIITNNVAGWSDWIYDKADHAYDDVRPKIGTARTVAPQLRPADRARLAAHFEAILRGRWHQRKFENYDGGRDQLRDAHWAAAQGLEELRDDLTPERRAKITKAVMAAAEKPSKKVPQADRLAPLMMLELLDDAQKTRAMELALEHVTYDMSPATGRFLRLAREGRLPEARAEEVIQRLVRALGAGTLDAPTVAAMSETIAALAQRQPDNMRLATFEAVFGTRAQFSRSETEEKPVAYYAALRRLSPHRKSFERAADHLLASNRQKIDQLSWLLTQSDLDADRRAKALEQLIAAAEGDPRQDATWNAVPVVARMPEIPRERRVSMLLAALNRLSLTDAQRGNEFTYYARAVEAVRLLVALDAAK